nr:ribonuclease H-like domain-containing protein [Tanacetum cinerariifolium]
TSEDKASVDKPKLERKNFGPPLIEDWISDSEDKAELKPKIEKKTVKPSFAKIKFVKSKEQVKSPRKTTIKQGNPQQDLQDKGVIDIGCSRHMTRNMSYLAEYEEIDRGYVAFGDFKLTYEIHVLLKVTRKNNMYSVDLKNIVPKEGLTCLFVKATSDEFKLWHKRLGHLNFKTMNKLVKRNLIPVWAFGIVRDYEISYDMGHHSRRTLLDDYKKGKKINDLQLIMCGDMFKKILSQGEALKIVLAIEIVS